jgi:tetratricopeptide (TPR) repeat protein/multisubunit Na+/H+ antiporter MnhF subunit
MKTPRFAIWVLAALAVNAGYLAAFAHATLFYVANVFLHIALGAALAIWALAALRRFPFEAGIIVLSAIPAAYLIARGNTSDHRAILIAHIAIAAAALIVVIARSRADRLLLFAAFLMFILLPASAGIYRRLHPDPADRIENPATAPLSMNDEGAGEHSPFAPSSAQTTTGKIIPANFFLDSAQCGECHRDIYAQWKSSMHHFASFNNQFYRKSIEHMQEVAGTRPSRWCAGCHDHAMFFNGRFDRPVKEQIDTPEAQAGLGCMSCHAIVHVGSSMGNGDFTVEYPPLHELASSRNPLLRSLSDFLTYVNPKPHRRTFLKPFLREQPAEFCSACHKVHLDAPVNNYRWLRGFNDYDNWQASGVSGQGARSFYYPPEPRACADCHMPLVDSRDPGNRRGKVHSHRFAAANMAVAYANGDEEQMRAVEEFLKSGFITVDIFAIAPVENRRGETAMLRRTDSIPANTSFAVGEEAEASAPATIRDIGKISAPIDASGAALEPGATVRVDVVVRTRAIGHFFPGGTVDAFDVWLELQACDADGRVIFWSGNITENGKGPVEPGAHFYRSYQLDAAGNPINKRNAWQTRSLLYAHLIPPGAADVAHFLVKAPNNARGPIQLTARLNYRKFSWYYTQFAYAGEPKSGQRAGLRTAAFDNLEYEFNKIPANVSGKIRDRIPDVPVVTLAEARASLPIGRANWSPIARKQDRERWNDWGIGLLLQGDLKGAEFAFKRVTEAEPDYADGWLNVARALIQEGETDAARPYLARALKLAPDHGRNWFFEAQIQKTAGDYDGALESLEKTRALYPRDRVVLNQIARILFLKRDYVGAIGILRQAAAVDPEDVQTHYTWMLCARGLGDLAAAAREQKLFERFKADEASQSITAHHRANSPEDNNERQPIHDHESSIRP